MEMMVNNVSFGGRRWSLALTIGFVSVPGLLAAQQGARAGRVAVRAQADTVVVADSTARARAKAMVISIGRIDSLLRLQQGLPIGSTDFVRIQLTLDSIIDQAVPSQVVLRTATTSPPSSARSVVLIPGAATAPGVGRGGGGRGARFNEELLTRVTGVMPRGWIGMNANGFHNDWITDAGSFVRYFEYPIVTGVDPSSPASRSGIRFGDSLMAYDGQDLRSGVFNLTKLLEPGRTLAIKLRRDGELKEFTLQVDKMPPAIEAERKAELMRAVMMPTERRAVAPAGVTMDRSVDDSRPRIAPRVATGRAGFGEAPVTAMARMPMPTGILGAQITEIDQEGLKTLRNDKNANGVVVTRVGEDSPAYRLGLRSGDVIAKVDDVKIESLWQLQHEMVIRRQNVTTKIVVLRGKKTQTLVYEQPNH